MKVLPVTSLDVFQGTKSNLILILYQCANGLELRVARSISFS